MTLLYKVTESGSLPSPQTFQTAVTLEPRRLVPDTRGPGRIPRGAPGVGARPRRVDGAGGSKRKRGMTRTCWNPNVEYAGRGRESVARTRILEWARLPVGG